MGELIPGQIIRWVATSIVLFAGAALTGLLWAMHRRPPVDGPIVMEGQVRRKEISKKRGRFEFHIDVRGAGQLRRDGRLIRIDDRSDTKATSIVCSPDLYSDTKLSKRCQLFCLPTGECLAAYQDERLIW